MSWIAPRARRDGLLTEEVEGELLVYDSARADAHRLNPTAATVWRHLDGERTVDDLIAILADEVGELADRDLVMVTLDELGDAGLLEDQAERALSARRESRRRFIRRAGVVGVAALALPVVQGIVVPEPAAAQTNCMCGCGCECGTCACG